MHLYSFTPKQMGKIWSFVIYRLLCYDFTDPAHLRSNWGGSGPWTKMSLTPWASANRTHPCLNFWNCVWNVKTNHHLLEMRSWLKLLWEFAWTQSQIAFTHTYNYDSPQFTVQTRQINSVHAWAHATHLCFSRHTDKCITPQQRNTAMLAHVREWNWDALHTHTHAHTDIIETHLLIPQVRKSKTHFYLKKKKTLLTDHFWKCFTVIVSILIFEMICWFDNLIGWPS